MLDLRTRRERRLTRNAEAPAWSPAGGRIAFVTPDPSGVGTDIGLVRPDGKGPRLLTRSQEGDRDPAWSPDGSSIAYVRDYFFGHDTDIYLMRADGGAETLAIAFNWPTTSPSWQPVR